MAGIEACHNSRKGKQGKLSWIGRIESRLSTCQIIVLKNVSACLLGKIRSHYRIEEKVNRQAPGTGDYKYDTLWRSLMQEFSRSISTEPIHTTPYTVEEKAAR